MIKQGKAGIEKYGLTFGDMNVSTRLLDVSTKLKGKISILSILYGLSVMLGAAVATIAVFFFGFVVLFQAVHIVLSIASAVIAVV